METSGSKNYELIELIYISFIRSLTAKILPHEQKGRMFFYD